ncbi:GPBP1 protein, partial [Baryphthengus martii]|nr:GPBP1 protein [Baryphthengus martii]
SLNFEKHPENFSWTKNRYKANRRRRNSSDGFDPNIVWSNGGHFERKEKNGWSSQGRNGTENVHLRGGYRGRGCRTRTFHCGKGQRLHENNGPDKEIVKNEDKEAPKLFKPKDFPALNPEYERNTNLSKFSDAEYSLHTKSRSPRMLVTENDSTKELQIIRFPVAGSLHSQPIWNGTGTSVFKELVPKSVTPPAKPRQWKSEAKETKFGNPHPHESACGVDKFSPFKSTAKLCTISQNSEKEIEQCLYYYQICKTFNLCNWSNSSSSVDEARQPHSTTFIRIRTDKKNEFFKAFKQDRVEKKYEDENHTGQEQ